MTQQNCTLAGFSKYRDRAVTQGASQLVTAYPCDELTLLCDKNKKTHIQ